MRTRAIVTALAALATTVGGLLAPPAAATTPPTRAGSPVPALAASDGEVGSRMVTTWDPPTQSPALAAAAAAAATDCPELSRTANCETHTIHGDMIKDGVITGVSDAVMFAAWHTNARERTFTVTIHITYVSAAGTAVGISDLTTASCTGTCTASGFISGPGAAAGVEYEGVLSFTDAVATNQQHQNTPVFTTTPILPPDYEAVAGSGDSRTTMRCDNQLRGVRAGCIVKDATPTVDMSGLPKIAENIRGIQARGGYGVPGDDARALHRITREATINGNRRAVCSRRVVGQPPSSGLSCDEYPFASTKEGGTALGSFYRGVAWVPRAEQNSQGGLLSSFYRTNRVLENDPFWVKA
ncbi:NucA/NucB deoxyribonuclease domain-containing protein [Streptomyces sp. NPDC093225]|uniref:NucA/NucB deoxyribonuclease domain-containing protein n=1 Tax=Streptomyces sp. NPDC093225 TaxID=3366034 RepID=UPI00380B3AD6